MSARSSVNNLQAALLGQDFGAKAEADKTLASLLETKVLEIVEAARSLQVVTCLERTVESAVRLAGMEKYLSGGKKAVTNYNTSKKPKSKSKKSPEKPKSSSSSKAGLSVSVSYVRNMMKKYNCAKRISEVAPVYVAGVVEAFLTEVMTAAIKKIEEDGKKLMSNRHIKLALDEMGIASEGTVPRGGVIPFIHEKLLPKKKDED